MNTKRHIRTLTATALPILLLGLPAVAQEATPEPAAEAEAPAAAEPEAAPAPTTEAPAPAEEAAEPSAAPDAAAAPEGPPAPEPVSAEAEASDAEEESGASADAQPRTEEEEASDAKAEASAEEAAPAEEAAAEPSLTPLEVTTSMFSRFEYRNGYADVGITPAAGKARFSERDLTVYRARLGLRTQPLRLTDDFEAVVQFTPQISGVYGTTGTVSEVDLGVYEAYFRLQSEAFSVDTGRFMMNYGDALVIGNLGWHQTARAFEGIRSRFALGKGYLDVFATQHSEGSPALSKPTFAGDQYFWGAYAGLGPILTEGLDLDLYALVKSTAKTEGVVVDPADPTLGTYDQDAHNLLTGGLRVKQKLGMADYRLEAGVQVGTSADPAVAGATRDSFAWQADGEIGLSFAPVRVAVGGLVASGDDPNTGDNEGWDQLFPTAHKFLGLMDVIGGRTNVASGNLKVQAKLGDSTMAKVDGHIFNRLETAAESSYAGSEVDLQLIQKIGKPAHLRGLYGIFLPNEDHYGTSDPVHYLEVQLGLAY